MEVKHHLVEVKHTQKVESNSGNNYFNLFLVENYIFILNILNDFDVQFKALSNAFLKSKNKHCTHYAV